MIIAAPNNDNIMADFNNHINNKRQQSSAKNKNAKNIEKSKECKKKYLKIIRKTA